MKLNTKVPVTFNSKQFRYLKHIVVLFSVRMIKLSNYRPLLPLAVSEKESEFIVVIIIIIIIIIIHISLPRHTRLYPKFSGLSR